MTTIRDVAKEAGVSVASVSRYMDTDKRRLVHPDTQKQIEKVIQKFHYIPSQSARALSKQTTNTIGMVTPFSTDLVKSNYYEGLISGIITGMHSCHYDLKWIMIRDEEISRCNLKDLLQKHAVDGVIFLTWRLFPKLIREIETHSKLPVVLINDYQASVKSSIVYCSNQSGVEAVCARFIRQGYKKIGMLRGPEYISLDARTRFKAFKNSAKKLGFKIHNEFLPQAMRFDEQDGFAAITTQIKEGKLPRAIFCANDDLARGAIRALREAKIHVPDEVAVAGFDDSSKNEFFIPSLTSVRQPLEAMGRSACETLINLITDKVKAPVQTKFDPELVIRKSA